MEELFLLEEEEEVEFFKGADVGSDLFFVLFLRRRGGS